MDYKSMTLTIHSISLSQAALPSVGQSRTRPSQQIPLAGNEATLVQHDLGHRIRAAQDSAPIRLRSRARQFAQVEATRGSPAHQILQIHPLSLRLSRCTLW